MALFHVNYHSEIIGVASSMDVIVPQPSTAGLIGMNAPGSEEGEKYPTLYLLHGLSDDHTIWQRRTSIERYAAERGIAVVMPAVHRSFYADQVHGYRYWTALTEELPALARHFFPLSADPRKNFVAGLSMGGYGAFKWALTHPDRFAAAASLSGVLDLVGHAQQDQSHSDCDLHIAFGEQRNIADTPADLMHLATQCVAQKKSLPKLMACCGTADFLYEDNLRFQKHAADLGLPVTWRFDEGRVHEWAYWDTAIQRVLDFLFTP